MSSIQNVSAAVQKTTFSLASPTSRMTLFVFSPLNKLLMIRRWHRKTKLVFDDPQNFYRLAAGYSLNYFFGENKLLRFVAMCALISDRIDACINQVNELEKSYQNFKQTFRGSYIRAPKEQWDSGVRILFLSPSTILSIKRVYKRSILKLKSLKTSSKRLGSDAISLNLKLIDAMEVCAGTVEAKEDSINELFLKSISERIDQLVTNQERIHRAIMKHKVILERFLKNINSPIQFEELEAATKKIIEKTKTAKKVTEFGEGFVIRAVQHSVTGFAASLGLAKFVPPALSSSNSKRALEPQSKMKKCSGIIA